MEKLINEMIASELFIMSLERCTSKPCFIPDFYERFLASSKEIQKRFENTPFEHQNKMLLRSLSLSVKACNGESKALADLRDRARTHDRHHMNIKPEFYNLWLESLMISASKFDDEWCDTTERAWRKILGFVINRLKRQY